MSSHKDTAALIRELRRNKIAKKEGWDIWQAKNGCHYYVEHRGHRVATLSHTPSDYHSLKNTRADLRRAGFPFDR
jgi:hypothetical protein